MLFVNRWFVSLLVALVVLDGEVQAYRYFRKIGHQFRPVIMKPMPVGRFGFVRAENPNADGAMDAKSGEESSETASPAMDVMQGQDMQAPQMREMIHDSPHPVEIDMGPGMQARIMGFEGELDGEGNFGRAADGGEEEEEGDAQFRHFKHKKHKKHKYVIHTHHHYHHKKEGHGGGYGHHGYGKHDSYGHHGHGGGHHGYGGGHGHHGGDDGDDDYEPTYGHHGRYRRSSVSEVSPSVGQTPDAQALDRTALTHSSPDLDIPMEPSPSVVEPGAPTVYRQSVSRRQLVRSKNERLAQIGRDRAQRANRYADTVHDSDGPCPAEYVEEVGEVVGSAQNKNVKVASSKRPAGPFQSIISRMFKRPKKPEPVVNTDPQKPLDPKTVALRDEIGKAIADQPEQSGPKINTEMKQYLRTKELAIVGGPQSANVLEESDANSTALIAPLPGTFLPELGTIVSVRFVDESGRERSIPFELTSRHLPGNGTAAFNQATPLNYNFFYFHCLSPCASTAATTANGDRLRSMAKRMIEGLEGGRTSRTTGEEEGAAGEGSVPQRWLHRRRTKSEWRRRDLNAGRRRRPIAVEKVIERRTPEEQHPVMTPTMMTPESPEVSEGEHEVEEKEAEEEQDEEVECDDPICSNFYVDEQKLTTTSTTPRAPEHRLDEELEPRLVPFGNELDQDVNFEVPPDTFATQQRDEPKSKPASTRNSLWRGISKRLSAFRERQADRSGRRKMVNLPEQTTPTTADPNDEDEYDSNEIVEYYQQDVGRVLYRMANGRLLEEPQRLHLRRSSEGGDGSDTPQRKRRLNRLANRAQRRRQPAQNQTPAESKTPEASNNVGKPVINIGTFRLADNGGATSALENTGAARSVSGTVPADMDSYIMQKVREYCSTSCASGKSAAPVIIVPEKPSYTVAYAPAAVAAPVAATAHEPIVGSSKQLIVQPASTYETASTSAPKSAHPPACPTKIVKCIPKALASSSKRSRKTDQSNDQQDEKESNPLVSLARGSMTP